MDGDELLFDEEDYSGIGNIRVPRKVLFTGTLVTKERRQYLEELERACRWSCLYNKLLTTLIESKEHGRTSYFDRFQRLSLKWNKTQKRIERIIENGTR